MRVRPERDNRKTEANDDEYKMTEIPGAPIFFFTDF